MSFCKHGRKDYKCSICKREEAQAYSISLVAQPTDPMTGIDAGDGTLFHTGGIQQCPVLKKHVHPSLRRLMLIEWNTVTKDRHGKTSRFYRLKFETPEGAHHLAFVPVEKVPSPVTKREFQIDIGGLDRLDWPEMEKAIAEYSSQHIDRMRRDLYGGFTETGRIPSRPAMQDINPYREHEDSEYLCAMIARAIRRDPSFDEATSIVNEFLRQYAGPGATLDGPPEVLRRERSIVFPTTRGPGRFHEAMFYEWLMTHHHTPDKSCVLGVADFDCKKGDIVSVTQGVVSRAFQKPVPANIEITLEGALDRAEITGPCEILINGHKLRAVREGNKLHLVTEDYRKLV